MANQSSRLARILMIVLGSALTLWVQGCKKSGTEARLLDDYQAFDAQAGQGTMEVKNYDGIEMRVYLPPGYDAADGKKHQLAIYLHGDADQQTGRINDYEGESYVEAGNFAMEHDLIFVAAKAPNGRSWWNGTGHKEKFSEALRGLETDYSVSQEDPYLYAGASGGTTFLTMQFMPSYMTMFPGVVAGMCGGSSPNDPTIYGYVKSDLEQSYFYYTFGSNDFLAQSTGYYGDQINPSVEAYRSIYAGQGFTDPAGDDAGSSDANATETHFAEDDQGRPHVVKKVVAGIEHCGLGYNWYREIERIWGQHLGHQDGASSRPDRATTESPREDQGTGARTVTPSGSSTSKISASSSARATPACTCGANATGDQCVLVKGGSTIAFVARLATDSGCRGACNPYFGSFVAWNGQCLTAK